MRLSLLYTATAAALCLGLSACAPVDTGVDQCSDVNVNLIEIKDAKYTNLPQSEGGLSPAKIAKIDALMQDYMNDGNGAPIAGCGIGVTRADQVVFLKGYGLADVDNKRPFTVATPSAIGSISKTLTALAALRMTRDRDLSLGTKVYAALGETPLGKGDFTLEQLLTHKAGFKGMPSFNGPFNDLASINTFYAGQNIEWPSLRPRLVFPGYGNNNVNQFQNPGQGPEYSNIGYSIAGALIDQRSREADIAQPARGYENYIWQKVARGTSATEPTMISACLNTSFRAGDNKNHSRGYSSNGTPNDFTSGDDWGWEGPPGGWSMTIGDLARLMLILQSDAVIPKSVIDGTMRKDVGIWGGMHIGLGLEVSAPSEKTWFGKGGDIAGYTSDMKIWPNDEGGSWGVAFLCNQSKTSKNLTGDIHQLLISNLGGVGSGGFNKEQQGAKADSTTPDWIATASRYEPLIRRFAASYLESGESPERAWAIARRELLTLGNGRSFVAALEGGDFQTAVNLLPTLRWADGSPVTP